MPKLDTVTWLLQLSLASPADRALRSRSAGMPIMRVPRSGIPCRACPSLGGSWLVWTWRHRCVQICPSKARTAFARSPTCRHQERRSPRVETGKRKNTLPAHSGRKCTPACKIESVWDMGRTCPSINQSIDQSINHPDPAHQSTSRFRAPAARCCKSDVMGAVAMLAHVSPTLYNTWRRGGGPHTILHTATGIPASLEFRDFCAPLISIGCVTDLRKRKSSRFQATHLHSRKTVYVYRCTLAG
jgi:hypothetical protein